MNHESCTSVIKRVDEWQVQTTACRQLSITRLRIIINVVKMSAASDLLSVLNYHASYSYVLFKSKKGIVEVQYEGTFQEPPEMCCQVMHFGRGRETESETNSTSLREDMLCGPSCSPCQTWGCWWSWRGAGQSPPSSRSCPHGACTRLPLRQTGRCACGFGGNNVIMLDCNIKNFTLSLWFPCALCHHKLTILNTFGVFSVCQRSLLLQFMHIYGLLQTETCATCWCVT